MRVKRIALLVLQVFLAVVGFLFGMNAIELIIQLVRDLNMSRLERHDKVIGLVVSPVLMLLCLFGAMWLRRKRRSSTIEPRSNF